MTCEATWPRCLLHDLLQLTGASASPGSTGCTSTTAAPNFLWGRALTISGGTSEIMRGLIGRQLLGLPRA